MKTAYLLLLVSMLLCQSSMAIFAQSSQKTNYKQLLQGTWVSVKDKNAVIKIKGNIWTDFYAKESLGSSKYFFYRKGADTIALIQDVDTLIYEISFLDDWNLDLNYLGLAGLKTAWSNNILSFKRE